MKLTDKITHDMVIDLLGATGLESDGGGKTFWCCDSEHSVDVSISGGTLKNLLLFIKKYYYDMGYQYGKSQGRREKIKEIRKAFQMD